MNKNLNSDISIISRNSLEKQDDRIDMLIRELGRTIEVLSQYKLACAKYAPDVSGEARDNLTVLRERRNTMKGRFAVLLSDIDIYAEMLGFREDMHDKAEGRIIRIAEHLRNKEK